MRGESCVGSRVRWALRACGPVGVLDQVALGGPQFGLPFAPVPRHELGRELELLGLLLLQHVLDHVAHLVLHVLLGVGHLGIGTELGAVVMPMTPRANFRG